MSEVAFWIVTGIAGVFALAVFVGAFIRAGSGPDDDDHHAFGV